MTSLAWLLWANVMFACFMGSLVMTAPSGPKVKDVEQRLTNHIRYITPAVSALATKTAGVTTAQLTALGNNSLTAPFTIANLTVSTQLTANGGANFYDGLEVNTGVAYFPGGCHIDGTAIVPNETPPSIAGVPGGSYSQSYLAALATIVNDITSQLQTSGIFGP